jgi:hypothetical protein
VAIMMHYRALMVLGVAALLAAVPLAAVGSDASYRDGVLEGGGGPSSQQGLVRSAPLAATVAGARVTLTFETRRTTCAFDNTEPLRDQYADYGVHFRGASATRGGAILHQCGSFGVGARHGDEFLAFNAATYAKAPERIRFDDRQQRVILYAANGSGAKGRFTLLGKRAGDVVSAAGASTTGPGYLKLRVSAPRGIDTAVLRSPTNAFVVDDLTFVPVV